MFEFVLYDDIMTALAVDLTVLVLCTVLLLYYGRLAHSHPAISYLCFHTLVVPSRLLAILAGAETLFSRWGGIYEPVTESEIVRATFLADVTLLVMTIAWIRASTITLKHQRNRPSMNETQPVTLSLRHIWRVAAIVLPIGILGIAVMGRVPGIEMPEIDLGEWQESSWIAITMSWAGLALLALLYWYGFRWWLVIPMGFNLFIMSIQGHHRFRVIIPLILMLQIYLDRKQKKWPPLIIMAPGVIALLLFFPMKTIGQMVQEGATFTEISESSTEIIRDVMAGRYGDQEILDQFASYLTLIDRGGELYYGTTYSGILTAPIPRQLWPDKPGLGDSVKGVSTPSRPMFEAGMIMTFIGEFYINFGYLGIIIMSYLTAYWLARLYFRAYKSNYYSVLRFGYLLIACNLIQVYRDGLMSLLVFILINMMPLAFIIALHFIMPLRGKAEDVGVQNVTVSAR